MPHDFKKVSIISSYMADFTGYCTIAQSMMLAGTNMMRTSGLRDNSTPRRDAEPFVDAHTDDYIRRRDAIVDATGTHRRTQDFIFVARRRGGFRRFTARKYTRR